MEKEIIFGGVETLASSQFPVPDFFSNTFQGIMI